MRLQLHGYGVLGVYIAILCIPHSTHAADSAFFAKAIRALIPDAPEMVEIARCESGLQQYTPSGSVLRGGSGGAMIGLFQLNELYHRSAAQALGYNIDTMLGNIGYARSLYASQGTRPWNSSASCWRSTANALQTTASGISGTLSYGAAGPTVGLLQRVLTAQGFLSENTFSPGHFDLSTLKALIAFQCKEGLACHTGTAGYTGLGRVSGQTLARINTLLTQLTS